VLVVLARECDDTFKPVKCLRITGNRNSTWLEAIAHLSDEDKQFCLQLVASLHLLYASGYDRRIVEHVRNFALRLLWLVRSPAHMDCQGRRMVAQELLDASDQDLDITARKFKARFHSALVDAKNNGQFAHRPYVLLSGVKRMLKATIRPNESLNKTLGLLDDRCPAATQALRSAVLGLKFMLGQSGERIRSTQDHKLLAFYRRGPSSVQLVATSS
jgi:hypothetical protein